MKWFVMVFFLSNNPVYNSEIECKATLLNRQEIMKYVHGLMMAYNGRLPGRIQMVNCIDEDQFNMLKDFKDMRDGKHDT